MMAKFLSIFALAATGFFISAAAGSAQAVEVDIKFSENLAKVMPKVNQLELRREDYFRRYRQTKRTSYNNSRRLARARWPAVQWANEVLIPDLDDFSVEALTRGFVAASLERASVSGVERVEITLDRLAVENYSLTTLRGPSSYAIGRITAFDAAGKQIGSAEVTANLVTDFLTAPRYEGNDFAFPDTSSRLRVGPTLAYFVYKGLGMIFPDREFARTVLITF